jgi:hypothetical protein
VNSKGENSSDFIWISSKNSASGCGQESGHIGQGCFVQGIYDLSKKVQDTSFRDIHHGIEFLHQFKEMNRQFVLIPGRFCSWLLVKKSYGPYMSCDVDPDPVDH